MNADAHGLPLKLATACPGIEVRFIDHGAQRYPTCGDWWFTHGAAATLHVRVSRMGDWRSELGVAVHEIVEALACRAAGIAEEAVTEFDLMFEAEREAGKHGPEDEPGEDSRAPYYLQHKAATIVERVVIGALNLKWEQHERNVYALD